MKYSKIVACTAPKESLLALHSQRHVHSIHDCFVLPHPTTNHHTSDRTAFSAHNWATCFFQSRAFQFESLLLKSIRWCNDFKHQSSNTSSVHHNKEDSASFGSKFFRVIAEKQADEISPRNEIILDSGPFLTWLAITPAKDGDENSVVLYHFGTLTKKPNALIHFVYPVHIWYSKVLLASGVGQHLRYLSTYHHDETIQQKRS